MKRWDAVQAKVDEIVGAPPIVAARRTSTWTVVGITAEYQGAFAIAAYEGILRPGDLYRNREFLLGDANEPSCLGIETWVRRVQADTSEAAMEQAAHAQVVGAHNDGEGECDDSRACGHHAGDSGHCSEMVCRNYIMKCGHKYDDR